MAESNLPAPIAGKYSDALSLSKDEIKKKLVPSRVEASKRALTVAISNVEVEISKITEQIQEACMSYPLDFVKICELVDSKELRERLIQQLHSLWKALFGE